MKKLVFVAALLFSLCCHAQKNPPMRLWYDRPAQWIPKIREALFKEDYARADSLQLHVEGHNSAYYQPLGTLLIEDLNKGTINGYQRQLSLDSAVVSDRFCRDGLPVTRQYFASAPDSLIAIRLTGGVSVRLSLTAQVPHKVKAKGNQLTQTGHATGDPMESIHFCTILQANNKGGTVTASDSSLTIRDAEEVVIYIVNRTSFNGFDHHPVREGAPYIEHAIDDIWHTKNYSYETFLQRHISDYCQYYDRVQLRLGSSSRNDDALDVPTDRLLSEKLDDNYLETLYFQYGRYLLISSSRTKGVPANLLPAHLFVTHQGCTCQPAGIVDPTPVVTLARQLHDEHQSGGELLASIRGKSRRDGCTTGRLCQCTGRERPSYSPPLLWHRQRLVCQS